MSTKKDLVYYSNLSEVPYSEHEKLSPSATLAKPDAPRWVRHLIDESYSQGLHTPSRLPKSRGYKVRMTTAALICLSVPASIVGAIIDIRLFPEVMMALFTSAFGGSLIAVGADERHTEAFLKSLDAYVDGPNYHSIEVDGLNDQLKSLFALRPTIKGYLIEAGLDPYEPLRSVDGALIELRTACNRLSDLTLQLGESTLTPGPARTAYEASIHAAISDTKASINMLSLNLRNLASAAEEAAYTSRLAKKLAPTVALPCDVMFAAQLQDTTTKLQDTTALWKSLLPISESQQLSLPILP